MLKKVLYSELHQSNLKAIKISQTANLSEHLKRHQLNHGGNFGNQLNLTRQNMKKIKNFL